MLEDHAAYCGPGAVAAVTGMPRSAAARAIGFWRERAGWEPAPTVTPHVLAATLLMRGYRLELWSPAIGGWRLEDADTFARKVWRHVREDRAISDRLVGLAEEMRAVHQKPLDVPEPYREWAHAELERRRQIERERSRRRLPRVYTAAQWLRRRRVGTWLLHVDGHVMAQQGGEIVSGDGPQYRDMPLRDAWRIRERIIG